MRKLLLTLVRHGKSSWQAAGQSDRDRPLNKRGTADAPVMAKRLADRDCIPELILCSSAVRTQQTAALLMSGLGLDKESIQFHDELYLASPATLLSAVQSLANDCAHVMIIAHNPGLEDLSAQLSDQCNACMPTLGIRHFSYASGTDLTERLNKVQLVFEDYPDKG